MLTPIDLDYIRHALATPAGWIELAAILGCVAIAWYIDHRYRVSGNEESRIARIGAGSVNRMIFPLTALLLLYLARGLFRHWHVPAFFPVAVPLLVALALIRLCIYALRNLLSSRGVAAATERAVALAIWGALLLYYIGVLPEIGSILEDTRVPVGKTQVSVLDLGRDAIVVIVALVVSLWVSGLIQQRLMKLDHVDINLRVVTSKFIRAIALVIGVLIALSTVGIDLTVLSVFGGALGVGIGLGLQKLASNYIAGFTILLDRSIRVGDMITVDTRFGEVSQVTSRYVVVRNLDGVEAIVPNETLITTTVLNHSYTSKDIKIGMSVQVGYDSDLEKAMQVMLDVATEQPRVLKAPLAPFVHVTSFADSGINLELGIWINDPQNGQGNLKSAINVGIWRAFKEHNITIPYPQREVRLVGNTQSAPGASLQGDPPGQEAVSAVGAAANPEPPRNT